jgi:hypothetical protein
MWWIWEHILMKAILFIKKNHCLVYTVEQLYICLSWDWNGWICVPEIMDNQSVESKDATTMWAGRIISFCKIFCYKKATSHAWTTILLTNFCLIYITYGATVNKDSRNCVLLKFTSSCNKISGKKRNRGIILVSRRFTIMGKTNLEILTGEIHVHSQAQGNEWMLLTTQLPV